MTEAKFTPGPWAYNEGEYIRGSVPAPNSSKNAAVATAVNRTLFGLEQWRDNKALIAAAPEMYKALEANREGGSRRIK